MIGEVFLSIASLWDIATKHGVGKLATAPEPVSNVIGKSGFVVLDIARHHCFALARLPLHHRDPFDRMLIAQAQSEQLPIMTSDRQFASYSVKLLSCGSLAAGDPTAWHRSISHPRPKMTDGARGGAASSHLFSSLPIAGGERSPQGATAIIPPVSTWATASPAPWQPSAPAPLLFIGNDFSRTRTLDQPTRR
jgi:PIN domain nuclease of toxin-antitoxin system